MAAVVGTWLTVMLYYRPQRERLGVTMTLGPHGFQGTVVNTSVAAYAVLTRIDFTTGRYRKPALSSAPFREEVSPNGLFRLRQEQKNLHVLIRPEDRELKWVIVRTQRGNSFRARLKHEKRVLFKRQRGRCGKCGTECWYADSVFRETVTKQEQHMASRWDLVCSRCREDNGDPLALEMRRIRERRAERRIGSRYGIKDIAWRIGGTTKRIPREVDRLQERISKLEAENRRLRDDMRTLALL